MGLVGANAVYDNNHRTTRLAATICGCRAIWCSALATSSIQRA